MKYLGVDYGVKRVGVAVSDAAGEFAFPKAILEAPLAAGEIAKIVEQELIGAIVLGDSIASNGASNDIGAALSAFEAKLAALGIPVIREYEGYSSVEAHRYQVDKGSRDDSAAAIILQRYLDKQSRKGRLEGDGTDND